MRSSDLHYMSAVDALAASRAGELSPVELTRAVLDQIERYNNRTGSTVSRTKPEPGPLEDIQSQVQGSGQ